MSVFANIRRIFAERRTREPQSPDERRFPFVLRTTAGVTITPDNAMTIPAVAACVRYLTQTVAVPPWHVMRKTERGGGQIVDTHHVDYLLCRRPSPEWSSFQFRETLMHWALLWGNGYAEIERDQLGRVFALHPIPPWRVQPKRDVATGELYYEVDNGTNGKVDLDARDVFHVRGFGHGPVGIGIVEHASEALGWAKAAELFGAAFFGNGMNIGGFIVTKQNLSEPGLRRLEAKLKAAFGGVKKALGWPVLDAGMEPKPITVEPNKGQFIETNQYLVEMVCRLFGVPPHKVQHNLRSTYNNIEHQAIEVVVDVVTPWAKRFEDEADYKLFGQNRQGFYTKMNLRAMLRGDMKARMEFYKGMQFVGAYSPNRILELEDEPTLGAEGDIHVMQQQMVPLKFIAEGPVQQGAPNGAEDEPAPEEDDDAREARMRALKALEPVHVE